MNMGGLRYARLTRYSWYSTLFVRGVLECINEHHVLIAMASLLYKVYAINCTGYDPSFNQPFFNHRCVFSHLAPLIFPSLEPSPIERDRPTHESTGNARGTSAAKSAC